MLRVLGRLWKLTPPKKQYTEMAVPVLSPAPRGSEPGVHGLPRGQWIQFGESRNLDGEKKNIDPYFY